MLAFTGERFVAVSEDPALMSYMSEHDMLGEVVLVSTSDRGRGEFSLQTASKERNAKL